jgi:hypothetical protein
METYGRIKVQLHAFFTSALDGGEKSTSRSGLFTHVEKALAIHWIGGWVGPRAGLVTVVKRKKSLHCPCRESNLGRPEHSLFITLTELSRVLHFNIYTFLSRKRSTKTVLQEINFKLLTTYTYYYYYYIIFIFKITITILIFITITKSQARFDFVMYECSCLFNTS